MVLTAISVGLFKRKDICTYIFLLNISVEMLYVCRRKSYACSGMHVNHIIWGRITYVTFNNYFGNYDLRFISLSIYYFLKNLSHPVYVDTYRKRETTYNFFE